MNLRELFSKYPLGCESFGAEWLRRWKAVGLLLEQRCVAEFWSYPDNRWVEFDWSRTDIVNNALVELAEKYGADPSDSWGQRFRVSLLDGTIVKEWGAE
jgi:hypothetical protein